MRLHVHGQRQGKHVRLLRPVRAVAGHIFYPELAQYLATALQFFTALIAYLKKYYYLYRYNTAFG